MVNLFTLLLPKFNKLFIGFLMVFWGLAFSSNAQLSLQYVPQTGQSTTVKAGEYWNMDLKYSFSSTTIPSLSGVKIVIPMPNNIDDVVGLIGTVHAPVSNFVWTATTGAKKLTITFVDPLPAGSTGTLSFKMRSANGIIPNGTVIQTCAEMTATGGYTSGQQCHSQTITAQPIFCAFKSLKAGGALNNETTYRISLGFQQAYPYMAPFGSLNLSNITLTDTYPAGAEFVSARVVNSYETVQPSTITNSGNSVTLTIPDYNIGFVSNRWSADDMYAEITLKYNTPTFSDGQTVTNNASVTFTPLGGSPTTITNGSTVGECTSDLIETHSLVNPVPNFSFTKTFVGGGTVIYPNQIRLYQGVFTNTGKINLDNVIITETVPPQLRLVTSYEPYGQPGSNYDGAVLMGWRQGDKLEYQTNLNTSWQPWAAHPADWGKFLIPSTLASNEYITKFRAILGSPLPPDPNVKIQMTMAFKANTTTTSQVINNCLDVTSTTPNLPTNTTVCNNTVTLEPTPATSNIYYNMGIPCSNTLALGETIKLTGYMKTVLGYPDIQNPTMAFLLPNGFTFVPNSQVFNTESSGITATPTFTVTPNFGGTNRTLYRWTFPTGTVLPENKTMSASIDVKISPQLTPNTNYGSSSLFMVYGSNIGIYSPEGHASKKDELDQFDWNGNGNTTEYYRAITGCSNMQVAASASMESIKWVKGLCDSTYSKYPNYGQTVPGGNADYQLIVKNVGNVTMKDIKIIDILPFIGDKGVRDSSPRNTQWTPNLADPITAPAGITVYYSTSGNPCRDEMKLPSESSPYPTGCETANWTTTPPANITTVKSVKIDFGTTTLAGGDSLVFSWPMRAPNNAPTNNEIAWNSFGFVATRTDNNTTLDAAEPNKVGIRVKAGALAYYGNRVWYDTNRDGIQDPDEGGVDGVKVKLFKVSSLSATPNPATDQLINFTITGNGGYYKFSNLQPGFYYAVFCLPTGYQVSPKNTGTTTNDSDGSPTNYQGQTATITAVTELISTEDDDSWDQGIYCNFSPIVTTNSPVTVGGTLTMSVSPNTGSYTWTGPNNWTATGASVTKPNITLADTGTYTVNIYQNPDATGCWATLNVNVAISTCTKPVAAATPATQTICTGATATAYTATPSTGVQYKWYGPLTSTTGALGTAISGATTATYTPTGSALTTAGTKYYAVVVNTTGDATCADTAFVTLVVNPKPTIANGTATICAGESVDLTSKITNYSTYLSPVWTAGGTAVTTPTAVKPTTTTTYVLVAQNSFGCKDTATVVVTVNAKPNAGTDQTLTCANATTNTLTTSTTLVPTPTGGTWKQVGTTPATANISGNSVTNMTVAGTYQFEYTLNGCKDTVAVIVSPCAGCVKPNAGIDAAAICQPFTTVKLTAVTTGGSWAPIGSPSNPAAATIDANGNVAGLTAAGTYKFVYSVTSGGQTCTDTAQVVVNPKPTIPDGTATICAGESVDLTSKITNYSTYLSPVWTAGGTAVATPTAVKPTTTTTYVLVAQNSFGCKDTATVVVTVNAKPNAGTDQTLACANATTNTLTTSTTLVPTPTGGTWKQVGTTPATASISGNSVTNMTVAGTYQFEYTLNGCKDTVAVIVSSCAGCVKPNAGIDIALNCPPSGITPTSVTLSPITAGGTWTAHSGNPAMTAITGNSVTGMTLSGIYRFIYSITSGGQTCTDTVQVAVPTCIVPKGSIGDYVWKDSNNNGIQDATESGVKGVYVQLLNANGTVLSTDTTDANGFYGFFNLLAGSYQVKILTTSLPNGCVLSSKVNQGTDDSKDSDFNPTTGLSDMVTIDPLGSGLAKNNPTIDAALYSPIFDLALIKKLATGQSSTVTAGANVTFTISVINQGDVLAKNIQISDYIPTGLTLNDANWNLTGNIATLKTSIDSLAGGKTVTRNITFTVNPSFVGTVTNVAEISVATGGTDIDSTPDNDSTNDGTPQNDVVTGDHKNNPTQDEDDHDIESVVIVAPLKTTLRISKTVDKSIVQVGDVVNYTIKVWNTGNKDTASVAVFDALYSGGQYVSHTTNSGNYNVSNKLWTTGALVAKGDTALLQMKVQVTAGGAWINTAKIVDRDSSKTCVSAILPICPSRNERALLTAPANYSTYQWYKNGEAIVGATNATYTATSAGSYTVKSNNVACPAEGCCPIIVAEVCECPAQICVPITINKVK